MSLWWHLKKKPQSLAEQTGIGEQATSGANPNVEEVYEESKRQHYATYRDEERKKWIDIVPQTDIATLKCHRILKSLERVL